MANTRTDLLSKLESQMVKKKSIEFKFNKTEKIIIEIDTKFLNTSSKEFIQEFFVYTNYMKKYDKLDDFLDLFQMLLIKHFSKITVDGEALTYLDNKSQTEECYKELMCYVNSIKNIEDMKSKDLLTTILLEFNKNEKEIKKLFEKLQTTLGEFVENKDEILAMMMEIEKMKQVEKVSEDDTKVIEEEVEMVSDLEGNKYANIQE